MTRADLKWKILGTLLSLSAIMSVTGATIEGRPHGVTQVPAVSNDPAVQGMIEKHLPPARLDPRARVGKLDLSDKPLKDIIDAIAKAGGITVQYASGMTGLDAPSAIALSDETVEHALGAVLEGRGLTFAAANATTAFIYPDTPPNREKYTEVNRVFPVAHADPETLARQLNRFLRSPTNVFQPMILTVREPRVIVVRAVPDVLDRVETWMTENDKEQ
jgi:hypothetical protein